MKPSLSSSEVRALLHERLDALLSDCDKVIVTVRTERNAMASLAKLKTGAYRITLTRGEQQKTVHLGNVNKKTAELVLSIPCFPTGSNSGAILQEHCFTLTLTLSQRERGHCLGVLTNSEYALRSKQGIF